MASAARNTRIYDICDPYFGDKGPAFERVFKPSFLAGIAAKCDKYANFAQHLRGEDPGGVLPTTDTQRANNPNHVNVLTEHAGQLRHERAEARVAAIGNPQGTPGQVIQQQTELSTLNATLSSSEAAWDESRVAFANRSSGCIAAIRTHVENPGIRAQIDSLIRRNHMNEWNHRDPAQRPPVLGDLRGRPFYPVGHQLAGQALAGRDLEVYQRSGNSLARHV